MNTSKRKPRKGTALSDLYPDLCSEWSSSNELGPDWYSKGSNSVVSWECYEYGHKWDATIKSRTNGSKCHVCVGKVVLAGFNDLLTTDPDVALDWSARNDVGPEIYSRGMHQDVWWKCSEGHDYRSAIYNRVKGQKCNICTGKTVLLGYNDLPTTHPNLVSEWSPDNKEGPSNYTRGSNASVSWVCPLGHPWTTVVYKRAIRGDGCPFCSGHRVWEGFNDLASTHPELVNEWSDLNTLSPSEVSSFSNRKAHWVCLKGHAWCSSVSNRSNLGRGCPDCALRHTSQIESFLVILLSEIYDVTHTWKTYLPTLEGKRRVDCVVADVVIEYDGSYWHMDKYDKDIEKTRLLLDSGYSVIRIRESTQQYSLDILDLSHPRLTQLPFYSDYQNGYEKDLTHLVTNYISPIVDERT